MSYDERDLLEKSKKDDIQAFESLVEAYQKKVFNIALRMVGNYDDAGDMAQEVFIRIFKSIGNFKGQSLFSTWVYRITANVCMDELRKRKNKKVLSIDEEIRLEDGGMKREIEDGRPAPDVAVERNELRKAVDEAIKSLPQDHKIVIILRDIQGFSYEEMTGILKCPEGTVKSRISRARQALKEILKTRRELWDEEYVK